MKRIYLDNASTSFPKAVGLGDAMKSYIENSCLNVNRTESPLVMESFDMLYDLRLLLCSHYGFENPNCVVFTKNVTEALNWIIKGLLGKDDHVVVSCLEHNAVMRPLVQMGNEFSRIPCDEEGYLETELAESLFRENTRMMIISAASNVFGSVQDLRTLCEIAHRHGVITVIDSAQASPFVDINMGELGIDVLAFTGHKGFLGPQGTGGFLIREDLAKSMDVLISGGTGSRSDSEQIPQSLPDRLTAGTENLVGLCGLLHSVRWTLDNLEDLRRAVEHNTRLMYEALSGISLLRIVGPSPDRKRTGVISVVSDVCDIAGLSSYLSLHGVETRVGLHCSPSSHKAMGTFPTGTLRFSVGPFTTEDEIGLTGNLILEFFGK